MVDLLKIVDDRQKNNGDWRASAYLEQKEKDKVDVVYETEYYRRSSDQKFMILFVKPKSSAGQGYLRLDKNLWFYDPSVGKWERRTERERIGGTNSRRSDFDESRLAEEYDPTDEGEEKLGAYTAQKLLLKGKSGIDLAFPQIRIWIDKDTKNILKRQEYALSGRLLRTSYYPKWKKVRSESKGADVWYPEEIRFYDEVEKANQTLVLIKAVDLRALPANLFTKAWLESKSAVRRLWSAGLAALLAASTGTAWAQAGAGDRPSEQDIFGGTAPKPAAPPAAEKPAAPAPDKPPSAEPGAPGQPPPAPSDLPPPAPGPNQPGPGKPPAADAEDREAARDTSVLGATGEPQHLSDYQAPENPLQIGGQIYLRTQSTAFQGPHPLFGQPQWALSAPSLLDVYLDARPNPRVRAFVLGRMSYDPTRPLNSSTMTLGTSGGQGAFVGTSATGFTTFSAGRGPNSLLDQMWIRFDVLQTVFVTAGKQHVRWGTGRFWQPTDFLHSLKRNPLDVFDARGGTSMLKLHVPWEDKGWNFYGVAVTEDPTDATASLTQVAAGGRAEIIILGAEVGIDALFKRYQRPRAGIDISTGIGDFDVYADVAIRAGDDFTVRSTSSPRIRCRPASRPAGVSHPADDRRRHLRRQESLGRQDPGGVRRELLAQVQRQRPVDGRRGVLLQPAGLPRRLALPWLAVEQHRRAAAELLLHRSPLRGAVRVASRALLLELHDVHVVDDREHFRSLGRVPPRLLADRAHPPLVRGVRGGPLRLQGRRIPPGSGLRRTDRPQSRSDDAGELLHLPRHFERSGAVRLRRRAPPEDLTAASTIRFRSAASGARGRGRASVNRPSSCVVCAAAWSHPDAARAALSAASRAACAATIAARFSSAFPTGCLLAFVESTTVRAALSRKRVIARRRARSCA